MNIGQGLDLNQWQGGHTVSKQPAGGLVLRLSVFGIRSGGLLI
jgi:hypothetical protein